jgi:hypothetical protein
MFDTEKYSFLFFHRMRHIGATQHNDTRHTNSKYNVTQHNLENVTLSIMTLGITVLDTVMLSVVYAERHKYGYYAVCVVML